MLNVPCGNELLQLPSPLYTARQLALNQLRNTFALSFACSAQLLGKQRPKKLGLGYLPPNLVLMIVGKLQQIMGQKNLKSCPCDLVFVGELIEPCLDEQLLDDEG